MPRKKATSRASDSGEEKKTHEVSNDALQQLLDSVDDLKKENMELKAKLEAHTADNPTGRRLVVGEDASKDDFTIPPDTEPTEVGGFAVFRSPSPNYHQVIRPGRVDLASNGEKLITPPVVKGFIKGVCVVYDEDEIKLMREKMIQKHRKGDKGYIEITDESIKEAALEGKLNTTHITNPDVDASTPLEELV